MTKRLQQQSWRHSSRQTYKMKEGYVRDIWRTHSYVLIMCLGETD